MKFAVERASAHCDQQRCPIQGAVETDSGGHRHWVLELNSIEELMKLVADEGRVLIENPITNVPFPSHTLPMLTIGDDYLD